MKKAAALPLISALLIATLTGCTAQDQDRAKADAQKASSKLQQDAKELGHKVDAAVQPDSRSASDKMAEGESKLKDATSKAGVKLDQAALLAKVKTRLASDAGLATLTKVDVSVDGSTVTLAGSVTTSDQKKAVEQAASQVDGVSRVNDQLVIAQ